ERAKKLYNKLLVNHPKDTVLLIGHGFIGKILITVITGKNVEDIVAAENLKNTSLSIFEIHPGKECSIISLDSTEHLF
ncbi:MAG TPA: hypothetical protein DEQ09_11990, partial [Bacteroidales bacterium]|nr:hypothetical protein [Bacteroidales bacterium]